jgi:hypothetical protein
MGSTIRRFVEGVDGKSEVSAVFGETRAPSRTPWACCGPPSTMALEARSDAGCATNASMLRRTGPAGARKRPGARQDT